MMNNEMAVPFDFMSIVDENDNGGVDLDQMAHDKYIKDQSMVTDEDFEFDEDMLFSDEDGIEEDVEEDNYEDTSSIEEALGQLGAIADDFELDFGSQKVSKGELVKLLSDRENIIKTRDAIDGLGARMVGREQDIELFYTVNKTETDKNLEYIYGILNDPSKWDGSVDIASLQRSRVEWERRKGELDSVREKAQAALSAQKQELDQARVQKVVAEMGSNAPLQEAAQYAESKGIDLNALVAGCSPALVLALQNAKKYEELTTANKKRLEERKQAKKPRSVAKQGVKTTGKVSSSEKARAQALYKAGKLTHADMFNFLED